ncbi:MAG: Hsp20/alpha crystallin family protein [Sulfuricella sp.]|nr:Hsp20/alpha crystallin family protein [Sulfuricella sp.]
MANITRYDPFDLAFEPFDDMFRGFFRPVRAESMQQPQQMQIKLDVKDTERDYLVLAEIPGVRKEDIHVTIEGNQVSISAEAKKETEEKEGEKLLRCERYYGKTLRTFTLPQEINEAESSAKYSDGVLTLNLHKKASSSAKKLSVQ